MTETKAKRIKIASASLSQIVYDYATNFRNLRQAIDLAVADQADILATPELSGTAYEADDYHQWNKNNDDTWNLLNAVARYANEKNPNLVVTVGVPWHYADKTKHADDPAYNINNRPFNAHVIITGGRVVAISAKSILADGPAEYEPRQFNNWPLSKGTIMVPLPDGTEVPFGKPIVMLGSGDNRISLTNEICAEGWPGVHDDLTIDQREQAEARHIVTLAKTHDLSIVLNPSASKPQPAINKERIRSDGLCKTGSEHCGVYVYTNYLGSASGTYAAEGSQIFAQHGAIIQHGKRYAFNDVSYSSAVMDVPVALRGVPDATASHEFNDHHMQSYTWAEAAFDKAAATGQINPEQLSYEEYLRSISLWLRDYLAKPARHAQGYVVSLSGGKDSAYGAVAVAAMIELDVKENGVIGFLDRFKHLKCKDSVLKIYAEKGEVAAIREIKRNILTCVYLPTENSSADDEYAARFLIEGGELPDGTKVDGIGGKFYIAPVQAMLEEATIAFTGLDLDRVVRENLSEILGGEHGILSPDERFALGRSKTLRRIMGFVNAAPDNIPVLPDYITKNCTNPLPTWSNPADDVILQNIQARIRLPIPWTISNQEGKISLTTSNESEAVHSYTTAGGDMHMGGVNPIGGMPKHAITQSLAYLESHGLVGLAPMSSLRWINLGAPSARLRKVQDGVPEQTDEKDLGFTYEQSQFIEARLIVGRMTPVEVFRQMRNSELFPKDPAALREILLGFAGRWESGQFKRIMGPLAPHVGSNVDPHQSVRTTVLGDHFRTGCAYMTLEVLAELSGGREAFRKKYGLTLREAKLAAQLNPKFKIALIGRPLSALLDAKHWREFEAGNREVIFYTASAPLNQREGKMSDFIKDSMIIDPAIQTEIIQRAITANFGDQPDQAIHALGTIVCPDGTERAVHIRHAVDAIMLDDFDNIVLITRTFNPGAGLLALPGGFIDPVKGNDGATVVERAVAAVFREAAEEVGISDKILKAASVTQLGSRNFDRPFDVRVAWADMPNTDIKKGDLLLVSTQGFCLKTNEDLAQIPLKAGDDAKALHIFKLSTLTPEQLGIVDHYPMIQAARLAAKAPQPI